MRTKANRVSQQLVVGALPAFTIIEVMVVAALSMLTMLAALAAWQVIERQLHSYQQETDEAIHLRQLQVLLEHDFLKASLVVKEDSSLVFRYPNYDVSYSMEEQQITRKINIEGSRDEVFLFPVTSWKISRRGEPVDIGIADAAQITSSLLGQPTTLVLRKTYSAKEILQFDDYAH
ncbi:MAG: hypothetical protein GC192_20985 [Bacteroidetes bacterium]|nr:hypothetical protein [Bacteroidota bacterium]